jgi:GntR family transcriptional regulator
MTDDVVQPLRTSRTPLSLRAQQYLLSLIEDGSYEPGEQFPSEFELAAQLGISRPTLREALLNLEQEGFIVRKHGVGTFVAADFQNRLESGLERLESLLELAARQGMQVAVHDLQVSEEPADAERAEQIQVAPGAPLTFVRRVIAVDELPVAYLVDSAPASILSPADVNANFDGSVLDLLRQKPGVRVAHAVAQIVAINADPYLADKLEVKIGQALLLLEETMHDGEGQPFEFSRNYFVPEFFRFCVVRR